MTAPLLVTSFRVSREDRYLLGGQDIFVAQLVSGLASLGIPVTVLTVRGRDDPPRAEHDHVSTVYLPVGCSSQYRAVEMNELGPVAGARVLAEYGDAVAGWIAANCSLGSTPAALINNDLIEASYLPAARSRGIPVITIVHFLFTELSFLTLLRGQAEWMRREGRLTWQMKPLLALFSGNLVSVRRLAALRRLMAKTGLSRLVPAWARRPYETERLVFETSDAIVVPAAGIRDKIIEYFRAGRPERLHVMPYPFQLAECAPAAVAELRQQYAIGEGDVVLLCMARISPEKGTDILLAALRLVERQNEAWARRLVLVICGRSSSAVDPGFAGRIDELIGQLRHVRVIRPGFVAGAAKTAHYGLADVVVSPSVYEAYGLSIVEGLALGKPVIASDTDGPRDLVRPEYGVLVPFGDPAARAGHLAAAILGLEHADLQGMSAAARRAGQRYTWPAWLAEFQSLLGRYSSGRG